MHPDGEGLYNSLCQITKLLVIIISWADCNAMTSIPLVSESYNAVTKQYNEDIIVSLSELALLTENFSRKKV